MVAQSMVSLLRYRANHQSSKTAYLYLQGDRASAITYEALDMSARKIAVRLLAEGKKGDRVLLFFPPGIDYIAAFLGCLYAGMVAAPLYPPRAKSKKYRADKVIDDCQARFALSVSGTMPAVVAFMQNRGAVRLIAVDEIDDTLASDWQEPGLTLEDPAFLQYTSGSTGTPKGVVVSHGNLIENERLIALAFNTSSEDICVSWLPMYHDMGLIGGVLQPLYQGFLSILMSPASFMQDPAIWLETIHKYRATLSGAPNFGFELCRQKISEARKQALDLSCWRVAFNGAEPVRADTLQCFNDDFAACGFRSESFYPCYGMAETTLFITGGDPVKPPEMKRFDAAELKRHRVLGADSQGVLLTSCGQGHGGSQIVIVNPNNGSRCNSGDVGEIWVSGPSVAQGYWNRPEESERIFRASLDGEKEHFLRTGDLGFILDGELYVTGRLKDIIILHGENYYPQDIEQVVGACHVALRPDGAAAFAIEEDGEERLVVVQEIERTHMRKIDPEVLAESVRRELVRELEVSLYDLVLIRPLSLPRTTSGKVKRRATRELFETDGLAQWARKTWSVTSSKTTKIKTSVTSDLNDYLLIQIAELLDVNRDNLATDKPLSELGLDSIMAMTLVHGLGDDLGYHLDYERVLEGGTIEALALEASAVKGSFEVSPSEKKAYPLPPNQRAIWLSYSMAPESGMYHMNLPMKVHSALSPVRLKKALEAMSGRHAVLRTTFDERDGAPLQRVHEEMTPSLAEVDAKGWSEASLRKHAAESVRIPFRLSVEPAWRVIHYHLDEKEHLLIFVVHHLISDLWSMAIFVRDFFQLYADESGTTLPTLSAQFHDFVRFQDDLDRDKGAEMLDFWSKQLGSEPPVLNLPTDRPRPTEMRHRGCAYRFTLPKSVAVSLKKIGQDQGATYYTVLLSAYLVLLSRYTNKSDLCVGTPVAGRPESQFSDVLGCFTNVAPLRADLSGNPTFKDLLLRTRTMVLACLKHGDYPFQSLVEKLDMERSPGVPPLVQTLFRLQKLQVLEEASVFVLGDEGRMHLNGLDVETWPMPQEAFQLDLGLMLVEVDSGLSGRFEYNADLFDEARIARMASHFEVLCTQIAARPDCRIADFDMLSQTELKNLTSISGGVASYDKERVIPELFERHAAAKPDAPALVFGENTWSYGELNQRANRLARWLMANGAGAEVPIGLCMGRSPQWALAMLAILKSGAAYIPCDPEQSHDRLQRILKSAGAALLLVSHDDPKDYSPCDGVLRIVEDPARDYEDTNPNVSIDADQLAYIIFTSGSTGTPKGVGVSHRNLHNYIRGVLPKMGVGEGDSFTAMSTVAADLGNTSIFGSLCSGGLLHLIPESKFLEPKDLAQIFEARPVDHLKIVPSHLNVLLQGLGCAALISRKTLVLGGEALGGSLVARVREAAPHCRILNHYGPTEATVGIVCHQVSEGAVGERTPIGKPLPNSQAYVAGSHMTLAPMGVMGELLLGGDSLARGYLGAPALTAEKFIPNPFAGRGARLYRTGDLTRLLDGGDLEFAGRLDHQVKIRGFRVELGEIEATLRAHAAVLDAVVITLGEAPALQLCAYVTLSADTDEDLLTRWVREQLPEYMAPRWIIRLDALPLTENGKINRKALPRPQQEEPEKNGAIPKNQTEKTIASIWEEILEVKRVNLHDNFYQLGGQSLLATLVISRVRAALGVELPVSALFENPTVAGLASLVERDTQKTAELELQAFPRDADLPLSSSQERLLLFSHMSASGSVYNMATVLRMQGVLDEGVLRKSLAYLIKRHETLRTTFSQASEGPCQMIGQPFEPDLPLVDLSDLDGDEQTVRVKMAVAEQSERLFDLEQGPLFRAQLIRLDTRRHLLIIAAHHIICDRWSLGVFLKEWTYVYAALVEGRDPVLPELPIQFADYAVWSRQLLTGERRKSLEHYWVNKIKGAPPLLSLKTDRARPDTRTYDGDLLTVRLSRTTSEALKHFASDHEVTLFTALLAAFKVVLCHESGSDDLVVGTDMANRNRRELENLIGFFINPLPLRTDLSGDPIFTELLARVHHTVTQAIAHQDLPFEMLVAALNPERDPRYSPVFQVQLLLQNVPMPPASLPGVSIEPEPVERRSAETDLLLIVYEEEDLCMTYEYNTNLFNTETIRQLARRLEMVLEEALKKPTTSLSHLKEMLTGNLIKDQEKKRKNRRNMRQSRRMSVSLD